jgi:hypothetical protein
VQSPSGPAGQQVEQLGIVGSEAAVLREVERAIAIDEQLEWWPYGDVGTNRGIVAVVADSADATTAMKAQTIDIPSALQSLSTVKHGRDTHRQRKRATGIDQPIG